MQTANELKKIITPLDDFERERNELKKILETLKDERLRIICEGKVQDLDLKIALLRAKPTPADMKKVGMILGHPGLVDLGNYLETLAK